MGLTGPIMKLCTLQSALIFKINSFMVLLMRMLLVTESIEGGGRVLATAVINYIESKDNVTSEQLRAEIEDFMYILLG